MEIKKSQCLKAEKGIFCLLSDLQNGVNTGAKRS